jgi:hypothetical protein
MHHWTPNETAYIKLNWQSYTDEELAAHFGRSKAAIKRIRQILGLLRNPGPVREKEYTPFHDNQLVNFTPSPSQIREACLAIRATWDRPQGCDFLPTLRT